MLICVQLFFVDDGLPPQSVDINDDEEEVEEQEPEAALEKPAPSKARAAAWEDPSDPVNVSLASNQLRKLRDAPSETSLQGREYERRLRRQFERINPAPTWAKKRRRTEDEDGVNELLTSTDGILAATKKTATLQSGTLAIERLRDANQAAQKSGCGVVQSLVFHPSYRVPVLAVGTSDRRIRLYNVRNQPSPWSQV